MLLPTLYVRGVDMAALQSRQSLISRSLKPLDSLRSCWDLALDIMMRLECDAESHNITDIL